MIQEKRLLVVRHGEGHHQTDKVIDNEALGARLTELGVDQAKELGADPVLVQAIKAARTPLFITSNIIRAVETMIHIAPGRPLLIQPAARERIHDRFDRPAEMNALKAWLDAQGVKADMRLYEETLEQVQADSPFSGSIHDQYVRTITEEDTGLPMIGNPVALQARAKSLIQWLGSLEADTIVLVAHGALMMYLDAEADQSWFACISSFATGEKFFRNCECREYSLFEDADEPDTKTYRIVKKESKLAENQNGYEPWSTMMVQT